MTHDGGGLRTMRQTFPIPLLLTLAVMSALSPVATDVYLPAFTHMAADLGATAAQIQLTLTTFMIGVALGQLVCGVLSDRWGRRPVLLVGTAVCLVAGIVTVVTHGLGVLLVARFFQGLGGASGMVLARAVVADKAAGLTAARAMSIVMAIQGVAPILAPVLGGALVGPIGWRGIFAVVTGFSAVMMAMILTFLPETLPPERRDTAGAASLVRGIGVLVRRGYFTRLAVLSAMGMFMLMAYISSAPFLVQSVLGLGTLGYTLIFAGCSAVLTACISLAGALAGRVPPHRQVRLALGAALVIDGALAAVCIAVLHRPTTSAAWVAVVIALLVCHVGWLGFFLGNTTVLALAEAGDRAGTASALMGFTQFLFGGLVSPLVGLSGQSSAVALGAVLACGVVVANLLAAPGVRALPDERRAEG